jgi:Winged helix-turn helix
MPKRISIIPHLTIDELGQRYRQATEPIERSHYQIIWLLAQGRSTEEVSAVTGYGQDWIYELVRSYNRLSIAALGDLRRHNPGGAPKLNDVQQAQLLEALRFPPHRSLIFPSEVRSNREKGLPSHGFSEKSHPILARSQVVSSINRLIYIH